MSGARRLFAALGGIAILAACPSGLDLEAPREYPCTPGTEGECPDGWRCGLEGYCHDRAVAAAYRCASDEDCEQQWHCGVEGVCYDRNTVGDVPCRDDVPEDCAPGWRCGLDALCHDRDAGAPYLCEDDSHCELGWRCGPQTSTGARVCVDSLADSLRQPPEVDLLEYELAHPRVLPGGLPQRFVRGADFCDPLSDGGCRQTRTYAHAGPGGLTVVNHFLQGDYGPEGRREGHVRRLPVEAPVTGLATVEGRTFVLDAAALRRITFISGAIQAEPLPQLPAGTDRLEAISWAGGDLVLGRSPAGVISLDPSSDAGPVVYAVPDGGAALPVTDVRSLGTALLAATPEGLFVSAVPPTGEWFPVHLADAPNAACATPAADAPVAAAIWVQGNTVFLETHPRDDATAPRALLEYTFTSGALAACGVNGLSLVAGPCDQACPGGAPAADVRVTGAEPYRRLRCPVTDELGTRYVNVGRRGASPSCNYALDGLRAFPNELVTRYSSQQASWSGADETGMVWDCIEWGCVPWLGVPALPAVLVGSERAVFAQTSVEVDCCNPPPTYRLDPELGSVPAAPPQPGEISLCAPVVGAANLAVARRVTEWSSSGFPRQPLAGELLLVDTSAYLDTGGALEIVSVLDRGTEMFDRLQHSDSCFLGDVPVFHGAAGAATDGAQVVVVAGTDRVWSAIGSELDGGLMPIRMNPLPDGRITSLAATGTDPASGDYFTGYMLDNARLFRLRASSKTRWFADELVVEEGDPLAVWSDGTSGRLGMTDGRVYALPSRVQIAGPLAGVGQFVGVCGHGYALAADGLHRLVTNADGGAVGTWERVTAVPALGSDPARARTFVDRGTLVIRTDNEKMHRLVDPTCP